LSGRRGPKQLVAVALGPLLAAHVLILTGAFLLVTRTSVGGLNWAFGGSAAVAAGVASEVSVLLWCASLVRAARAAAGPRSDARAESASLEIRALCPGCGWVGPRPPSGLCPRCRRATVRGTEGSALP
jgi:hypothetical protein